MKITNIENLLKFIYELNPVNGRYCYRGQSKYSRGIIPSVHRIPDTKLARYQTVIYEAFLLYIFKDKTINKPHIYTNHPIEFLAMCQHYGVPTRLLDWSKDILTALYFGCNSNQNYDGALFICDKTNYKDIDLEKFHESTHEIKFIDMPIINPRLRSQSGCFMLWGNDSINSNSSETYNLEGYLKEKDITNNLTKLVIPRGLKPILLSELKEKYGITKKTIYQNNQFSKKLESEYKVFKIISSYITTEMTKNSADSEFFRSFPINLAGTINLKSMPENAPNGFSEFINHIVSNEMKKG